MVPRWYLSAIFAAITAAVVLVSSFGCGQQGASNTPSGSTEQATTSPTESPEPHATTEETIIADEESTQATQTTEETTALPSTEGHADVLHSPDSMPPSGPGSFTPTDEH
jgi:hypothetical protein